MEPTSELLDAQQQRAIEEVNWQALTEEVSGGIRTQEEIELLFSYWFHHRHTNELDSLDEINNTDT